MLVLTRKPGEQIVIAGNIRVTVVSLGQGRVKIGVEAPTDVTIDRQEIFEKRLSEQLPTMTTDSGPSTPMPNGTLHNRILDRLPSDVIEVGAAPVTRENRIRSTEHRFPPRKPR